MVSWLVIMPSNWWLFVIYTKQISGNICVLVKWIWKHYQEDLITCCKPQQPPSHFSVHKMIWMKHILLNHGHQISPDYVVLQRICNPITESRISINENFVCLYFSFFIPKCMDHLSVNCAYWTGQKWHEILFTGICLKYCKIPVVLGPPNPENKLPSMSFLNVVSLFLVFNNN